MELKTPHADWLRNRGIDPVLADKFGLYTAEMEGKNWLAVPYVENGRTVNHKYRLISDKSAQRMDKDGPLVLANHDCLLDQSLETTPLIVTEGEWDMLACLTAGKRRVVSVPNGAPSRAGSDDDLTEGARYAWFWRHETELRKVRQVILAVDNDEPGKALAADLCRLFGPERCLFVEYPAGCKDANDVLSSFGPEALIELLDRAKPYPVKGLYGLDDFPEQPEYQAIGTGIPQLDEMFRIVPRTFTVVTGYAGQGKTSFLMWIIAGLLRRHIHVTIASFETDIKPVFKRKLMAALLERGEFSKADPQETAWAEGLIRDYVAIIAHAPNGDEDQLTLDDVIELFRASVIRNGTRFCLLDPWNEVDHLRERDETETEYTSRSIRALKRFAKQNDVALWVIAHPAKPQAISKGKMPSLYDISGSAHWANKADYGIVFQIKNREFWTTTIACAKVRMGLPGRMGNEVIQYNPKRSLYTYYGDGIPMEAEA